MGEPIVTTPNGKIRGALGINVEGNNFLKFLGVPYAKPPVGNLRFLPPQALEPWTGVLDATQEGNRSVSRDDFTQEVGGSEDCLNVNIYVRTLPPKPNEPLKPVMVYIHGGGLAMGCNRPGIHGPAFLMTKDIVLVVMNYRLGILGFLSVDGTEVYGNMGLKDQNFALKWVQKNIQSFGGDPRNVTIFGESAGSASVHAHILSPASKGLFHRAIMQSGCSLNFWFFGQKNNARKIVSLLGQTADSEKEALEILKQTPALDILGAQEKVDVFASAYCRPFGAVVEKDNETAFLTEDPRDIIRKGTYNHVPFIMGYTDNEGLITAFIKFALKGEDCPPFELSKQIPFELNAPPDTEENTKIVDLLKNIYQQTGDDHNDEISDTWFLVNKVEALKEHLRTTSAPIYLYRISLVTKLNHFKRKFEQWGAPITSPGVAHSDDLGYLWHSEITPNIEPGSPEERGWRLFVDLWTNFAIFGEPTPNESLGVIWSRVKSAEHLAVFDIGEKLEIKEIPEKKRLEAWFRIYASRRPILWRES